MSPTHGVLFFLDASSVRKALFSGGQRRGGQADSSYFNYEISQGDLCFDFKNDTKM